MVGRAAGTGGYRLTAAFKRAGRSGLPRWRRPLLLITLCAGVLAAGQVAAGGAIAYEVGTAGVGLASAGYGARARDASTVLIHTAGMTRLDGT